MMSQHLQRERLEKCLSAIMILYIISYIAKGRQLIEYDDWKIKPLILVRKVGLMGTCMCYYTLPILVMYMIKRIYKPHTSESMINACIYVSL